MPLDELLGAAMDDLPSRKRFATDRQLSFFPVGEEHAPMTLGAARHWVGDFFEEATSVLTGAIRLATDSRCEWCPDLQQDEQVFLESKGVGRSGQLVLYQRRLAKDRCHMDDRNSQLFYALWSHNAPVAECKTRRDLFVALAVHTTAVTIVPLERLEQLTTPVAPRVVNSGIMKNGNRNGYGEGIYGIGWTLSLLAIRASCRHAGKWWSAQTVYRLRMRPLDIWIGAVSDQ